MRHSTPRIGARRQTGSALVVAIFVIVVLGLLVSVLSRLVSTSSDSVVVEIFGGRAFNAAQSGLQQATLELYPVSGNFTGCTDGQTFTYDFSARGEGLQQCRAEVSCKVFNDQSASNYDEKFATHYRLTSVGSCQSGIGYFSRKVAIETRNRP
ncbi:Type II secretory pathway component [Idiomarina sp. OT37-5b]|jgi:MSHA biogenesis protein MshP|nr:Type II secretory pathway component [Idiomarina sp. OT37-5b]